MTAPELHGLALRIADHLDGLASAGKTGDVGYGRDRPA